MAIYGEDKKTTVDLEELLDMMQRQNKKKGAQPKEVAEKPKSRHFPITTLVLVALVIALGTMVTILKADITSLKSEISELKNLKTQIASIDPKLEIASLETKFDKKIEESTKEREKIKADLAQILTDIETLKTANVKKKTK
ncbi:MAG: hypothetical protein C0392_03785 [Syntrophus sp. (in: bacteria)]|nr:hypothetical protein [Syntrophus sp. (in: bacteria)]